MPKPRKISITTFSSETVIIRSRGGAEQLGECPVCGAAIRNKGFIDVEPSSWRLSRGSDEHLVESPINETCRSSSKEKK